MLDFIILLCVLHNLIIFVIYTDRCFIKNTQFEREVQTVRLREVIHKRSNRRLARTPAWCPLRRGVRLQEVTASRGLTVHVSLYLMISTIY